MGWVIGGPFCPTNFWAPFSRYKLQLQTSKLLHQKYCYVYAWETMVISLILGLSSYFAACNGICRSAGTPKEELPRTPSPNIVMQGDAEHRLRFSSQLPSSLYTYTQHVLYVPSNPHCRFYCLRRRWTNRLCQRFHRP